MWLATVPNRGENPSNLFSNMQKQMSNCKLHRFEIPSLVVGTLDSLMALSDDLNRINQQVEVYTFIYDMPIDMDCFPSSKHHLSFHCILLRLIIFSINRVLCEELSVNMLTSLAKMPKHFALPMR
jgi:hypothetical protein